jgi:2-methylcitrate dehydratase PrpD
VSDVDRPPATRRIAGFVDRLGYADLPEPVVDQAKRLLLDFLAAALAGGTRPHVRAAQQVSLAPGGGAEQSTVLATDRQVAMDRAAFLNGLAGSSTPQLDDVCKESLGHPGVGTHPAVLAVGEARGSSGRDALVAIVAGYELAWRVGAAVGLGAFNRGWHPRGGCNVFAAAVAAAKLLGLHGEDSYCAVLGLAGNQAAGLMSACFWHDAWYLLSGHASQNGVMAALLARAGYTAGDTVLEDPYGGYCTVVCDRPDWDRLLVGLGERFELPLTGQKLHASSAATHAAIDATLALADAHDLRPDQVATVQVRTYQVAAQTLGKRHPDRHVHAAMSIPYLVAVALTDRQVSLPQFTADKLADPQLRALQDRVEMVLDPQLDAMAPRHLPAEVIVNTTDGRVLTERVVSPKGDPDNPLTDQETRDKFRMLAAGVLRPDAVEETIELVDRLDELADLGELTAVLRRTGG